MTERRRRSASFTWRDYGFIVVGALTVVFLGAVAATGRLPQRSGTLINLPDWSRPLFAITALAILIYEGIVFSRQRSRNSHDRA